MRDAIAKAVAGDTINFSVTSTLTLNLGELLFNKNLTTQGPGAAQVTISGDRASRVVNIVSGVTVVFKEFGRHLCWWHLQHYWHSEYQEHYHRREYCLVG